jgi:hypothetical protein
VIRPFVAGIAAPLIVLIVVAAISGNTIVVVTLTALVCLLPLRRRKA